MPHSFAYYKIDKYLLLFLKSQSLFVYVCPSASLEL